ncbi:MAG: hypothetical protein IT176_01465 [Acidobacteria bacterium]|nr:hypothetical protein [Acidobacteriota bacterium]
MMRLVASALVSVLPALLLAAPARAGDRYALVVTGAAGGGSYALQYDSWRAAFVSALRGPLAFDPAHVTVLGDADAGVDGPPTREEVQRRLREWAGRLTREDLLFVLLIGHGTRFGGEDAKFNLVGPDLSATEWAALLAPISATLALVDTTGASFPFMAKLARPGRLILTATDSSMQQYDTVFPEFFVRAFEDPGADLDKNGRTSIWEAFNFASARVRRWFEQSGRLPTERPVLDDDGDGIGREAQSPGRDGTMAGALYLDAGSPAGPADAPANALARQRADLEARIEALRQRRSGMAPDAFDAELERLLTRLARLSQQMRAKER